MSLQFQIQSKCDSFAIRENTLFISGTIFAGFRWSLQTPVKT
jgi:hypothetical protein